MRRTAWHVFACHTLPVPVSNPASQPACLFLFLKPAMPIPAICLFLPLSNNLPPPLFRLHAAAIGKAQAHGIACAAWLWMSEVINNVSVLSTQIEGVERPQAGHSFLPAQGRCPSSCHPSKHIPGCKHSRRRVAGRDREMSASSWSCPVIVPLGELLHTCLGHDRRCYTMSQPHGQRGKRRTVTWRRSMHMAPVHAHIEDREVTPVTEATCHRESTEAEMPACLQCAFSSFLFDKVELPCQGREERTGERVEKERGKLGARVFSNHSRCTSAAMCAVRQRVARHKRARAARVRAAARKAKNTPACASQQPSAMPRTKRTFALSRNGAQCGARARMRSVVAGAKRRGVQRYAVWRAQRWRARVRE